MKKIYYLPIIPLIALLLLAFVPALTDFDSHSFNTAGNKVGMLFTNAFTQTGNSGLPAAIAGAVPNIVTNSFTPALYLGGGLNMTNTVQTGALSPTNIILGGGVSLNYSPSPGISSLSFSNSTEVGGAGALSFSFDPLGHNPNSVGLLQTEHDMVIQAGQDAANNSNVQLGTTGHGHEGFLLQYDLNPDATTPKGYSKPLSFAAKFYDGSGSHYVYPNIQGVIISTNMPGNWALQFCEGQLNDYYPQWSSGWSKGAVLGNWDRTNLCVANSLIVTGSVTATLSGSFSGQFTNAATINYSNLWYSTLAARKTNLGRRATLEIDIGFVDAATGTPVAQVVIENDKVNPGITNTWTCAAPGTIVSTVTNHYTFKLNTNAVVTVTDISRGTGASVTIANSLLSWE